jgi:plastocyanin
MKKVAALLVLALAALTLVACGGSDSSSESTSSAETTAESTGGESEGAGAGAGSGGAGSGSSVVKIEAAEGTELAYATKAATAKAGQVSIEFTNPQSLSHDVAVEDSSGKELGKTELVAGGSTTATIGNLKPGEYTFFCTVPGHREAGMEGTLTVE